jgi:predicted Zn finger-like uncharacterized protein
MKIACSNCQTKYQIADEKVPVSGAKAKCPNCGQQILISARKKDGGGTSFFTPSPDVDFGQTIAYDFSEVDQSQTEVTALLKEISGQEPFLLDDTAFALRDVVTGQEFPITKPVITLGRSEGDITLSDPEVSRKHCLVKIFGERFVIVDLGSTNGTFFAGKKIMTAYLGTDERFTVGNTTLEPVVKKAD